MNMRKVLLTTGGIVLFVVVASGAFAIPVWLLWNWLMPVIFGLPTITVWQALGLALLANCLTRNNSSGSSK